MGSEIIGTWDGSQRRYFLKDHLGSVRTTVDQSGNVDGYDDYYPFGLVMPGRSSNSANPTDNYKFTGHERDDEAGLTIDYMIARGMDPMLGRFMQIDPMYMERAWLSPYNYVQNNPLNRIDPTGMLDDYIFDENGNFTGQIIKNDQPDKIVQKNSSTGEVIGEYQFADPVNDTKAIRDGEITNLVFPSDQDINQTVNDAGVFELGAQLFPKLFAANESRSGNERGDDDGKIDFVTQQVTIGGEKQSINANSLYVTNTTSGAYAHNQYNYGNFLWGAASKALGIGDTMVRWGANRDSKKYNGEPDSEDDQRSIFLGREQETSKIKN